MELYSSHQYKPVNNALPLEGNSIADKPVTPRWNIQRCWLCVYHICYMCIWVGIIGSSLWSILWVLAWRLTDNGRPLSLGCGSNVSEAREHGCEFDLLSYSWTPAKCMDYDTAAEFVSWVSSDERVLGAWPFFEDVNARTRIPNIDILSTRIGVETRSSQEQHLGHCIFWMRRTQRIQEGQGRITVRGDGLSHAMHCTASLLARLRGQRREDEGEAHAVFSVGFNRC